MRASQDFRKILEYIPYSDDKKEDFNLKDKMFLCDLWEPKKLYNDIDLNNLSSSPFYFKNLEIGILNGAGNHTMFKAINGEADYKVQAHIIDETEFLKKLDFYNGKVRYNEKPYEFVDHRCLILMFLIKLKTGLATLDEYSIDFYKMKSTD